jgi:hypothetical protein
LPEVGLGINAVIFLTIGLGIEVWNYWDFFLKNGLGCFTGTLSSSSERALAVYALKP